MFEYKSISPEFSLREITLEDAPMVFSALDAHRDYLASWLPFIPNNTELAHTETFISSILAGDESLRPLTCVVLSQGQLAGLAGFNMFDIENSKSEIGYWLIPPFQGMGLAAEATKALCNWAFDLRGINRVQIRCGVENRKSNRVPLRLSFRFEGVERAGERLFEGGFRDVNIYSLLKNDSVEWRTRP